MLVHHIFIISHTLLNKPLITSYVYPGYVPGNAFSFNEYGLIMTTNAEFGREVTVGGLGRNWIVTCDLRLYLSLSLPLSLIYKHTV